MLVQDVSFEPGDPPNGVAVVVVVDSPDVTSSSGNPRVIAKIDWTVTHFESGEGRGSRPVSLETSSGVHT